MTGTNGSQKPENASAARQADSRPTGQAGGLGEILGQAVWLMTRSMAHRHIFIADLEWMVIPPVELGQFRMYRRESMPVAFASWALVSEETEKRLASGMARLAPTEWRNGDRLWLVELLAPFGNTDAILDDLKKTVFAGKSFKLHRRGADGVPRVEIIQGAMAIAPAAVAENLAN